MEFIAAWSWKYYERTRSTKTVLHDGLYAKLLEIHLKCACEVKVENRRGDDLSRKIDVSRTSVGQIDRDKTGRDDTT